MCACACVCGTEWVAELHKKCSLQHTLYLHEELIPGHNQKLTCICVTKLPVTLWPWQKLITSVILPYTCSINNRSLDGWWWRRWSQRRWKDLPFLKERQQQSDLHCPGALLGLGHHCSSSHFNCHRQHSSQDRPTKIPTTLSWLPSCNDAYPEIVCEVIIVCLTFGISIVTHFNSLWRSRHPMPPGLPPSRHQGGAES